MTLKSIVNISKCLYIKKRHLLRMVKVKNRLLQLFFSNSAAKIYQKMKRRKKLCGLLLSSILGQLMRGKLLEDILKLTGVKTKFFNKIYEINSS